MKISALIPCSSIMVVFCFAANATQQQPVLLDAAQLSPKLHQEFSTCVLLGMDKDRSREIAKIKAALSKSSKSSVYDSDFSAIADMAINMDLAHDECAKKMNIDPATVQHIIVK